jgi:transposase
MELAPLLFGCSTLRIAGIRLTSLGITIVAEPGNDYGSCPVCGQRSRRIHSHYQRKLQDLPAHGRAVQIELHLRRFFCDLPDCPRHTFAERWPQISLPHARKTCRLLDALRETAFTTGGEAGARLAAQLAMPVSGDTLLRLLRHSSSVLVGDAPRVLGVDDWALRRGQVYGTILCDLESHRPVDLLPERSSQVLAAWLQAHPGTEIISRDRGSEYANGAALGAPHALQVADRWHLLHNLTEALQRAVDRRSALLSQMAKEVAAAITPTPPIATEASASSSPTLSRADQQKQQSRQRRMNRYQQVQELVEQGASLRQIGRTLKMSRGTVKRLVRCEQFPERATPTPRALPLVAFVAYLKRRWEDGCDNVTQLWHELRGQSFNGSIYMVRRQVRRWRSAAGRRPPRGPQAVTAPRIIRPSARRIAWLALGHVRQPTPQDEQVLKAIYGHWPELQETAELCRQFASLLKEHDAASLEAWVQLAEGPGIDPEITRFVQGLRQDWAAVLEAARQPWSQGQVEGQINRLKLIKRQMYGRANFDLLRERVLHEQTPHAKRA